MLTLNYTNLKLYPLVLLFITPQHLYLNPNEVATVLAFYLENSFQQRINKNVPTYYNFGV